MEEDEVPQFGGVIPLCAIEVVLPPGNKSKDTSEAVEKNFPVTKIQHRCNLLNDDNASGIPNTSDNANGIPDVSKFRKLKAMIVKIDEWRTFCLAGPPVTNDGMTTGVMCPAATS